MPRHRQLQLGVVALGCFAYRGAGWLHAPAAVSRWHRDTESTCRRRRRTLLEAASPNGDPNSSFSWSPVRWGVLTAPPRAKEDRTSSPPHAEASPFTEVVISVPTAPAEAVQAPLNVSSQARARAKEAEEERRYKTRCLLLERKLIELRDTSSEQRSVLVELRNQLRAETARADEAERAARRAAAAAAEGRSQAEAAATDRISSLSAELSELRAAVAAASAEAEDARSLRDALRLRYREQLSRADARTADAELELRRAESELTRARKSELSAREDLERFQNRAALLEEALKTTRRERDVAASAADRLEAELDELEALLAEMEPAESVTAALAEVEADRDSLKRELGAAKRALREREREHESEMTALQLRLEELQRRLQDEKEACEELELRERQHLQELSLLRKAAANAAAAAAAATKGSEARWDGAAFVERGLGDSRGKGRSSQGVSSSRSSGSGIGSTDDRSRSSSGSFRSQQPARGRMAENARTNAYRQRRADEMDSPGGLESLEDEAPVRRRRTAQMRATAAAAGVLRQRAAEARKWEEAMKSMEFW